MYPRVVWFIHSQPFYVYVITLFPQNFFHEISLDLSISIHLWKKVLCQIGRSNNPATFILQDSRGNPVAGGFYEYELQRVANPDVYLVETILREKGDDVYVKWLGMDKSHNSWIHKNNVL